MRYAILSDIHANVLALEKVLEEARRQSVEAFLCLGDVVGYGARPNECCDYLRDLKAVVVRGNHDEAAVTPGKEEWFTLPARECIRWTRDQLTAENQAFLESLQPFNRLPGAHLCHGALSDPDLYTTSPGEAFVSLSLMEERCCFLGHTHYAEWYVYRNDGRLPTQHLRPQGGELQLVSGRSYVINPGAVGQPRDSNSQASFAIWDNEASKVTIYRVSYEVETTRQQILAAGLPPSMADRLPYGV